MYTIPTDIKTLVVKIGTAILTGEKGFDGRYVEAVVKDLAKLKRERDINIVIISSGAIGCGMVALNIEKRPDPLPWKQAVAAVGQSRLMHYYEVLFQTHGDGLKTAQVLLTAAKLEDRQTYLNIRNTMRVLFDMGDVIPIINENDSVATEELKFGDNDTLAARVASKIGADLMIILSNVDGLYDKNPDSCESAKLIEHVDKVTDEIEELAGGTGVETSVGGMRTKVTAARMACAAGVCTILANGHRPSVIHDVLDGSCPMTVFCASPDVMPHRKRWIAFGRIMRGSVIIDHGAGRALLEQGKSLLAAGIVDVDGTFDVGSGVKIVDSSGNEIACGLVNYSSEDILKIKGCKSGDIRSILGRHDFDAVIHRDNLVLL